LSLQLDSAPHYKKQKHTWNDNTDEDEKRIFIKVSSKKQKVENAISKKSRANMKKKKRKSRINLSMRTKLQL
jgi:hypothetical protein